jgi:outer membrane lipoprotein LolB
LQLRFTFLAVAVLLVTACGRPENLQEQPSQQDLWESQQAAAGNVLQWNLYARAALRLQGEVYNIGIRWQRQQDRRFMMLLEAPFGQGIFRIDSSGPGVYRLLLPDGQSFNNATAEALLEDAVGWSLPISGLDAWIRGLPHAQTDYSHRLDSKGRARSIKQDGWDIEYLDYQAVPEGLQLPRRMRLVGKSITLKLVIEHWQPAQAEDSNADLFPSFN